MTSRLALLAAALTLLAPMAAHAERRHRIDLPAGSLGEAIVALSRDTGASIRLADPALWRRPVRAVQGRMNTTQALERLLTGSGVRSIALGHEAWVIATSEHRPARPRPAPVEALPIPAADIVVSASKREVPIGRFPGSVSVFSGAELGAVGPAGSDAIANRAADITSTHLGNGRDKLFIRGVADSGLVGQSQATVGQYLGDIRLSYNAPDPSLRLYDIASIEILEGPQGTLYGAGSPGGIIRIVRNDPVPGRFEAAATAGASAVSHGAPGGDGSAMLNLPIMADKVTLRLVGYAGTDGGYIDNLTTGRNNINRTYTQGGRAALRIDPGDGWAIRLGMVAQNIHGNDSQYADKDAPPLTRASAIAQPYDDDYRMAEATVTKDWGDVRFTSSNAFVRQDVDERFDATLPDNDPRLFRQRNRSTLFTSENRLSRSMSDGFGWVIGTSYLNDGARITREIGPVGLLSPAAGVLNRIDEETLYSEASLQPLHGLTLTAGARLTHSRLAGHAIGDMIGRLPSGFRGDFTTPTATAANGPYQIIQSDADIAGVEQSRSETKLLPSASASIEPSRGLILYTRYQQGFRPGGLAIGNNLVRRFRSDRVATLETGLRYDCGNAISLAASLAYTDWRNIQADFVDGDGLPVTANIGDGRIWSFDARVAWRPFASLRLEGSIVANDSRLTRPDYSPLQFFRLPATAASVHEQLPNVTRLGGRAGFDWQHRIGEYGLSVDGWGRYVGKSRLGVGPMLGGKEGDYVDTGFSLRFSRADYGVTLSATNLLNTVGNRFALGSPIDVIRNTGITPLQPRTLRIGFDAHF